MAQREEDGEATVNYGGTEGNDESAAFFRCHLQGPTHGQPQMVSVPDALLCSAHVVWKLLTENTCTEGQKDTVCLLAHCLQHKFDTRTDNNEPDPSVQRTQRQP